MSLLLINQFINSNKLCEIANYSKDTFITYQDKDINIDFVNDEILFKQNEIVGNEDKSIIGFMLGEIYDIEEKKNELKLRGHVFKSDLDAEYIVHLYEEYGETELKKLNGKFVISIYDKLKKEIIILNDRYGYHTYFYTINKGKYSFCNNPNILLEYIQKRKLNEDAVYEFFSFGYLLDNKTLFENISKLEPASIIRIKNNRVVFDKYWKWIDIKKNLHITYEQAIETLGLLWIKSIKKILNKHEKFVLQISGGLDSRAILAAIDFLGLNYKIEKAYTIGQKNCWDYLIAKEVCKIANIKHELVENSGQTWLEASKNTIVNSIGSVNCYCGWRERYIDEIYKYPVLNGLAGDLVLGGSFLPNTNIEEECQVMMYNKLRASGLKNIQIIKNIEEKQFRLDNIKSNKSLLDYYYLDNSRVRNFTVTGGLVNGTEFNDLIPFFENELIDFVYSLPDDWRINSKLYKDMLIKFFPKFFIDIPWQKNGKPIKRVGIYNFSLNNIKFKKYHKNSIKIKRSFKPIVLFGASNYAKKVIPLVNIKYNNIILCDNDKNKWGKSICGYQIISPIELMKNKANYSHIFITSIYYEEISRQLDEYGIKNYSYYDVYNKKKMLYHKEFAYFDKWIRNNCIKNEIYSVLSKCKIKFFNQYELEKILELHMNKNIDLWRDILLLFTYSKFYQIYFLNLQDD